MKVIEYFKKVGALKKFKLLESDVHSIYFSKEIVLFIRNIIGSIGTQIFGAKYQYKKITVYSIQEIRITKKNNKVFNKTLYSINFIHCPFLFLITTLSYLKFFTFEVCEQRKLYLVHIITTYFFKSI